MNTGHTENSPGDRRSTFRCARCHNRLPLEKLWNRRIQRSHCTGYRGKGYGLDLIYDGPVTPRGHRVVITRYKQHGPNATDHD